MIRLARIPAALVALAAALAGCAPAVDRVAIAAQVREVCDGVDNDGDGLVDDVDANGDGLCDCLRIGVLGYPGSWGTVDRIAGWMHARDVATVLIGADTLTPEFLGTVDVILVQDVRDGVAEGTVGQQGRGVGIGRAYTDAEVGALQAWVAAGGGLMTLAGFAPSDGETANVNRLLAPFGLSYGAQHVLAPGGPLSIAGWATGHAIARGVSQVSLNGGRAVSGGTLVAWEPAAGVDVGRAGESGQGRVLAWADEWIEYDSEWSRPELQVLRLWQNALRWLTPARTCQIPLAQ